MKTLYFRSIRCSGDRHFGDDGKIFQISDTLKNLKVNSNICISNLRNGA